METKNMKSTMLKNGNLIRQNMKKIIYCIFIALIAISCNPPAPPLVIPMTLGAQTPIPDYNTDRNRAALEDQAESWDDYDMDNTRTYAVIDPNDPSEYFQYWSADDKISVFFTTANLQYSLGSYKDNLDYGIFDIQDGSLVLAPGSSGCQGNYFVEICLRGGSASKLFNNPKPGDIITLK